MQGYQGFFADSPLQLPDELGAVALSGTVHPVAALARIKEVLEADHLATRLVDEPFDERARLFTEQMRQPGIALVVVLTEDVFCHQPGGIVEDSGLALEAGSGGGDQARRARGVASDLG